MTAIGFQRFALGCFNRAEGAPFLGLVIDDRVTPVASLVPAFGEKPTLLQLLQDWSRSFALLSSAIAEGRAAEAIAVDALAAHAPLPRPAQVFCTGANYAEHVIQMILAPERPEVAGMSPEEARRYAEDVVARQAAGSNPFIFMKPVTAIAGPEDPLPLPYFSSKLDWELELAAVVGREAYRVARSDALSYVAGYMVANDMTARDRVRRTDAGAIGADWIAGKGSPGFLPIGPLFVPSQFIADPHALKMRLWVNGELKQNDTTGSMTFDIPRQIEYLSGFARLLPGDILCTGTPAGNGIADGSFLKPGDVIEAEIEGLGRQTTLCVEAAAARRSDL